MTDDEKVLKGKIALVTGGAAGIGKAVAIAFATAGAKVVVNDRNADQLNATVKEICDAGGEAIAVPGDVGKTADIEALINTIRDSYGKLHFACNNAGYNGDVIQLAEGSEKNFDAVFQTNVKGVWLCMKHEIPLMIEGSGGSIVNIASTPGVNGFPGLSVYCATKHAVIGMSKAAALDYADQGIRINVVAPGAIETEWNVSKIRKY